MLTKVNVYDLKESIIASGYPMKAHLNDIAKHFPDESDSKRAIALGNRKSNEGHDNFLAGILVSFDLTCSIKMWTEFERYHFAQIVSSQSTMHRLSKMCIDEVCVPYTDPVIVERLIELQKTYNKTGKEEDRFKLLYSCPTGLTLTARVTTNYRQLKTMYLQRWNHALPEWEDFCEELLHKLPSFEALCLGRGGIEVNGN